VVVIGGSNVPKTVQRALHFASIFKTKTPNLKSVATLSLGRDAGRGFQLDCAVVCRLWDLRSGQETKKVSVDGEVTSAELSADGSVLTLTYGNTVAFWDADTCVTWVL
jgi:WD40 repeat protein